MKKTLQLGSSARVNALVITLICSCILIFSGCGSGSKSLAQAPGSSGSPAPGSTPAPAASPNPGQAANGFYVSSSTGNDSNSGTAASPWKTLAHAATMVKPGAVVHVLPGTYGDVTSTVSGTPTARIRFISDTKWGAHLVGTAGGEAVWLNNGSNVDIMGFDITGNSPNGLENLGSFSRMIGNRVHDIVASCDSNGGSGINNASYTAHDDDIIGNVVFNIKQAASCGALHGVGIYHSNLRGHVLNNFVAQTGRPGIQLWHAANNVVVANNTVVNTRDSGIVIGAGDSPGGVVCNNTTVTNNISINNAINGIQEFGSTGPNNKYLNNLAFGNSSGDMSIQTGSASGTILSNPQFVNYTGDVSGDYHLQSSSPAIDSGTTTAMPSTDLDGGARPVGSGPDIGAYEYNSPAAAWPWM